MGFKTISSDVIDLVINPVRTILAEYCSSRVTGESKRETGRALGRVETSRRPGERNKNEPKHSRRHFLNISKRSILGRNQMIEMFFCHFLSDLATEVINS